MKVTINKTKLKIYQGDITNSDCQAIVNAANNHLWMGGGVAGAIKKKGGNIIEKEAVNKGPIQVGEAVITTGGKLKAKYVIHAAAMSPGRPATAESIVKATKNCLKLAEEEHIRSIAFPALGTGVAGFPLDQAADIMLEEIISHLKIETNLKEVILALYGIQAYQIFEDRLKQIVSQ